VRAVSGVCALSGCYVDIQKEYQMTADFRTEFTDRLARKRAKQEEDYCFDCKRWIDTDDVGHQEHDKLSNRIDKGE